MVELIVVKGKFDLRVIIFEYRKKQTPLLNLNETDFLKLIEEYKEQKKDFENEESGESNNNET
jgi:hypothetical protein